MKNSGGVAAVIVKKEAIDAPPVNFSFKNLEELEGNVKVE
jgi:hypothetical protein